MADWDPFADPSELDTAQEEAAEQQRIRDEREREQQQKDAVWDQWREEQKILKDSPPVADPIAEPPMEEATASQCEPTESCQAEELQTNLREGRKMEEGGASKNLEAQSEGLSAGSDILEEPAFEYLQTRYGRVGALVHRRRGGSRDGPAVVLVPGNPGVIECEVGKYHSHIPGMKAIAACLRASGIPFVQFDFAGVGLSAPAGPFQGDWHVEGGEDPSFLDQPRGITEVVMWARENLSDRVVLACWNWSGYAAAEAVLSHMLHGFVSVSMPYNIIMIALQRGDRHEHDRMKAKYEQFIANCTCPALYVCGNKDAMCPPNQIKRMNKPRDPGDVDIYEVNQKGEQRTSNDFFNMAGHEEEVAGVIADWIRKRSQGAEGLPVKDAALGG